MNYEQQVRKYLWDLWDQVFLEIHGLLVVLKHQVDPVGHGPP